MDPTKNSSINRAFYSYIVKTYVSYSNYIVSQLANIVNYYVVHSNYIVKPSKYNFKVLAITVNVLAYWKYFFNINTDRLRY